MTDDALEYVAIRCACSIFDAGVRGAKGVRRVDMGPLEDDDAADAGINEDASVPVEVGGTEIPPLCKAGEKRCSNLQLAIGNSEGTGETLADCGSGMVCINGECNGCIEAAQCDPGSVLTKRCGPTGGLQQCVQQGACTAWGTEAACLALRCVS